MYSKVNQLYIYIYLLFFFYRFFSRIDHYRGLSRVPCTIQQVLISYLFYILQCVYVSPNLPIYPPHPLSSGNHKFVFYICDSYFVNKFICTLFFFLDSTYKWYHMIFVFLCLSSLTYFSPSPHNPWASVNHLLILCIYDSVSVLLSLFNLFCFLDSTYK